MASYTPNLNLYKPDSTDDFGDFRAEFNNNMDILDQGGGGGSGGHTIYDPSGNALAQESGLQFTGAVSVSDDSANGKTVVDVEGGGNYYLNTLYSTEEKKIGYWTDGKPLYQKTFSYTPSSTISITTPIASLSSEIEVKDIQGVCINSQNSRVISLSYSGSNLGTNFGISASNVLQIEIYNDSWGTNYTFYATIQYTKTTDTADPNPQTGGVIYLPTIYSEEEREVGVWRDGKPLYSKTISCGTLPNSATKNVAHSISNIEYAVIIQGSAKNPNNGIQIPLPYVYGNIRCLQTYIDPTYIKLISTENMSVYTQSYVTILYTKTTDVAGSGTWNGQGGYAHHYSTSEKVIGTWIDGKPLYEITVEFSSEITVNNNTWTNTTITTTDKKAIVNVIGINQTGTCWNMLSANCDNGSYVQVYHTRGTIITIKTLTIQYTKTTD